MTVLDVRGMISWHIVVGTLLVPVALLKTAAPRGGSVSITPAIVSTSKLVRRRCCCACLARSW